MIWEAKHCVCSWTARALASSSFAVLVNIGCHNKTCTVLQGQWVVQLWFGRLSLAAGPSGRGVTGVPLSSHPGKKRFLSVTQQSSWVFAYFCELLWGLQTRCSPTGGPALLQVLPKHGCVAGQALRGGRGCLQPPHGRTWAVRRGRGFPQVSLQWMQSGACCRWLSWGRHS